MIPEITVLDIQRMSTEDGPGLRTTVFLKGCNLHCTWCHNPESINPRPVIQWHDKRCIGCQSCRNICESGAVVHSEHGITIEGDQCILCLKCTRECPSGALTLKGEKYSCSSLLDELLKDKAYFAEGGGVTLSGGEPLLQKDAVIWLLSELQKNQVHTALDTAGKVPVKTLFESLAFCNLLLYDIKLIDSGLHKKYTDINNVQILENLKQVKPYLVEKKIKLWLRTPVIPETTDSKENITGIGKFIAEQMDRAVERWELCAFNNLCTNKYELTGQKWSYESVPLMQRSIMDSLVQSAQEILKDTSTKVIWTGSVRTEKGEE